MPTAAEGAIAYGLPATVAVAGAPGLVRVTEVTLSVPCRPVTVNSVPAKVTVVPYGLVRSFAVIVRVAAPMASATVPLAST